MEELYNYMIWGDYNKRMDELASLALDEPWSFGDQNDLGILKNYMKHTFFRLLLEKKVIETEEYCVFNTGLFTKYYEQIYAYGEKSNFDWKFREFCTDYDLGEYGVNKIPERADYFWDPTLLVFDWHYPVNVQYKHILEDESNRQRLPRSVLNSKNSLAILKGSIDISIKRVMANYKQAVPQYFNGKIQLLLPLYFEKEEPELALVVTRTQNGYYQGHTCLTMEMAYNNARLIARPESNWLVP